MSIKSRTSRSSLSKRTDTYGHENNHSKSERFGSQEFLEEEEEIINTLTDLHSLEYFLSSMFATIIEDSMTALRVLDECNNELSIIKVTADMDHLLALKYNVQEPDVTDELAGIDALNLDKMEYKLNKLFADRKLLAESLMKTYLNLSLNKNWKPLADVVHHIIDREAHFVFLIEEELKNKQNRRDLMRQLRQQRNHIKSVIYENDVIIDGLKTKVEDAALNAEIRSRYTDNWQRARTEQHYQTIIDKETGPAEVIESYKQKIDSEQRVHTEVEMLINLVITETLEKVEQWMEKYDKDMEKLDLKIQIKKLEYQNTLDKRIDLEETIEKHEELISGWKHFKIEREKERQYREKMHKAATTVQAWWRGLLVRLRLGPYKPSKKGKPASAPVK